MFLDPTGNKKKDKERLETFVEKVLEILSSQVLGNQKWLPENFGSQT